MDKYKSLTLSIKKEAWNTVNAIRYKKVLIEHRGVSGSCSVNSVYSSYIITKQNKQKNFYFYLAYYKNYSKSTTTQFYN